MKCAHFTCHSCPPPTSEATTNDQVTEQAEEIKRLRADRDAAEQMVAELRAMLTTGRDIVIETSRRHTQWVEDAYDIIEASAHIANRWCLASERLRAEAKRAENDPAYETCPQCGRVDLGAMMCWRVGHLPTTKEKP